MTETMEQLYNLKEGEELLLDFTPDDKQVVGSGTHCGIEQRWLKIPTNVKGSLRYLVITVTDTGEIDTGEVYIPDPEAQKHPFEQLHDQLTLLMTQINQPKLHNGSLSEFMQFLRDDVKNE